MEHPKKPVRIIFLTSLRDVGADDRNGQIILTKEGHKYMKGIVEHAIEACHPGGALHGVCEVAGVVTDDSEKDLAGSEFPITPTPGRRWIHPLDLRDHEGTLVTERTVHLPSLFRALPIDDLAGRYKEKKGFETSVVRTMKEFDANVVVSDHYMAKIEFLIKGTFGLSGRVLNIHPAVTLHSNPYCLRGKTPTADAIARAKSGRSTRTGATLHLVNEEFDAGPVIHWDAPTPVYPNDTPEELRWRNYKMAKRPVFTEGMRLYVHDVLPHL